MNQPICAGRGSGPPDCRSDRQRAAVSCGAGFHPYARYLFSVAAHELLTPLTSLLGYTQLVERRAEHASTCQ